MENPQPNRTTIEKMDEEIWQAIRDLDPDQRRTISATSRETAPTSRIGQSFVGKHRWNKIMRS